MWLEQIAPALAWILSSSSTIPEVSDMRTSSWSEVSLSPLSVRSTSALHRRELVSSGSGNWVER